MKSIFKKIAFVLALAMVVTAFPAKTAAAASEPTLKSYRVLYIGGDKLGDYAESAWASVKKGDYSVKFASEDEEIVTVNAKNGRLHAVSTGEAVVTATFTKDGAEDIVKECRVVVKKNAATAALDADSEAALKELTAGDEVELKAVLTDADGSNEGISDGVRFVSDNKEVVTVDYKTGAVKAVAAGTANISVYAIQWDYSKADKKYVQTVTTEKANYEVVVKKPDFASVKQTASKVVAIKCDTEAFAKQVADNVSKLSAAYVVSENPVSVLVKSAVVDNNDKTVVNVTLYNDMIKDKTYQFAFDGGKVVEIVAADLTAIDHIVIATEKAQKATETQIKVDFYDANGIKINAGPNAITYTANPSADYYLTADGKIYFYEANKTAEVTVVYSMGYDKDGKKIEDKKDTRIITSFDAVSTYSDITGFAYAAAGKGFWELTFSNNVINVAVGDDAQKLYGRYTVTNYYNQADPNNYTGNAVLGDYKYESTDETKLLVGLDGMVTPVGAGAASVIVSRKVNNDYIVVGVANFSIAANRTLTTFEPSLSKVNLSNSPDDSVKLQMVVKDQLGGGVNSNMTYTLKLVKAVEGVTVTAGDIELSTTESGPLTPSDAGSWESYNKYFTIKATAAPATAKQVQILVTAQQGYGQKHERVVTLNVKAAGTESRYEIGINNKTLNLNFPKANGNIDNTYSTEITYNVYDQNGFLVETAAPSPLTLSSAEEGNLGNIYYDITLGNENKTPASGNVFKAYAGGIKAKNGTYVVRLYKIVAVVGATGTTYHAQQLNSASFVVSDDSTALALTQKENQIVYSASASSKGVAEAVKSVITIKRGTEDITGNLTYNSADYKEVNGKLYVNKINVTEAYSTGNANSFTYTYDITVNMLFEVTNTPGLVVTLNSLRLQNNDIVSITGTAIEADVTFTVKRSGVDEDGCNFTATYKKNDVAVDGEPTGLTLNTGSKKFEITENSIENATYDVTLTVTKGNEEVIKSFKIVVDKE